MKQPEFQEAYREARRESVGLAVAQLQRDSVEAVRTLREVSASESAGPAARVSAAKAILEMSFRAVELEELSARLNALEEANEQLRNER